MSLGPSEAFLFNAIYEERTIEIQVNPEFKNSDNAFKEALFYSTAIGRLPNFLLTNVKTVWIHKGNKGWGGGNENLLIHTGRSKEYISKDIVEETFIHEAAHTSLDWDWDGKRGIRVESECLLATAPCDLIHPFSTHSCRLPTPPCWGRRDPTFT